MIEELTGRRSLTALILAAASAALLVPAGEGPGPATLGVSMALAVAAVALTRGRTVRTAALVLAVAAGMAMATHYAARRAAERAPGQTPARAAAAAADVRKEIARRSEAVDAMLRGVEQELRSAPSLPPRAELFSLLSRKTPPHRGTEISVDGQLVAWWGEDFAGGTGQAFQFDVRDLYLVRQRSIDRGNRSVRLLGFERVPNGEEVTHLDMLRGRTAVTDVRFHAGTRRKEPAALRFLIARARDSTLFADITPSSAPELAEQVQRTGRSLASVLAALAIGLILVRLARRPDRSSPLDWRSVAVASALVFLSREVLLGFSLDPRHWNIFGYAVYASRVMGAFSRSAIDLLFTALAFLAIAHLLLERSPRKGGRAVALVLSACLGAAGALYALFVRDLIDNARVPPVPEHIFPSSAAQAALLASGLALSWTVLMFARTRPEESGRWQLLLLRCGVFAAVMAVALALLNDSVQRQSLLAAGAVLLAALIVESLLRWGSTRFFARALLAALLLYLPVMPFERASAQKFVSDTYAPLIVGESGQLRMMITDTLKRQFTSIDLATILPGRFGMMNLDDLAYALWLRSGLQLPSVITIDDLSGRSISRFGIGLPQFKDVEADETETLRLGNLTRELLHHDMELFDQGTLVARGSVHVLNPTDPGATAAADLYRDFFSQPRDTRTAPAYREGEVVVFDREGNVHGTPDFRLPHSPEWYFRNLPPGKGQWVRSSNRISALVYVRRTAEALYAFPLRIPTGGQHLRRLGGIAVWSLCAAALGASVPVLPAILGFIRKPRKLDFRTRTSLYLTAVVIVPLLVFAIFIRAYLADRLETEYIERGQAALNAAQRVIEDYLAASRGQKPDQILDDSILTWLARVVGHDLHLYKDDLVFASSRRELFTANVESARLPGNIYMEIVLRGGELVRAEHEIGSAKFVEMYSPIPLAPGTHYTLALPFIVQGRQVEAEVNDLATTIYLLLILVTFGALAVAYRAGRTVTRPVHALVGSARAVATGDFSRDVEVPSDPDLGLLVNTFRDMAQSIRRQQDDLRHERDRLQTLLENITAAVVVVDRSTSEVVATNRASRELFDLPGEADGLRFVPRFSAVEEFLRSRVPGRLQSREIQLLLGGQARTFRLSVVPLPEGMEEMVIAEDVTEILRSNRLQAWAEMARQVAHEIKNPLTPIQLTAEHLRAMAANDDPRLADVVRSGVDNILRQVTTLKETSKEFSDYASLKQPNRIEVDLRQLLTEIAADYRNVGQRKVEFVTEISPDVPSRLIADPRLLRGAIVNVIENAIQAVEGGGKVVFAAGLSDGMVKIDVTDSGPGVPEHLLPRIFDPYFSTKSSGTGLGLAIARKTIEEHGGKISADRTPDGFVVRIALPVVV